MAIELEEQLRSTSDEMLRVLDQLRALESEKRTVRPGSRRFDTLTEEIERLAAGIFTQARHQTQLGAETAAVSEAIGQQPSSIEEVAPREVPTILGEWREAERRLAEAVPGSPEAIKAHVDTQRLRQEYQRAHELGSRGSA
ncbi:MAG: hypothetical protein M3N29_08815 [Chloroflexota bacterium]|nr:hypothetical protein [Chloroflexota bacterium]